MTLDQDQVDSFMKIFNWTNFEKKFCRLNTSSVGTQLCVQWCTESVDAGHNCRKLTILQTMLQTWMLSGLYLWNEMKSQLTKAITSHGHGYITLCPVVHKISRCQSKSQKLGDSSINAPKSNAWKLNICCSFFMSVHCTAWIICVGGVLIHVTRDGIPRNYVPDFCFIYKLAVQQHKLMHFQDQSKYFVKLHHIC